MKNLPFLPGNRQRPWPLLCVVFLSLFVLLAVVVAGCDKESPLDAPTTDAQQNFAKESGVNALQGAAPVVLSVKELGIVSKPSTVVTRDGGESALIGGQILWTFGDTFFNTKAADGDSFRSNTAALANPADPLNVTKPPLDANETPYQALPFTAAEDAYNDATGNKYDRIALWFGGLVPDKNGSGLAFYKKLYVKGPLSFPPIGVGTAHFAPGKTTGVRDPKLLFTASEPQFVRPMLYNAYVYLYGNLKYGDSSLPFGVTRAPLAKATKRSAYQFWNGTQWSSNINTTAKVFDGIPGAVSVSYNAYLQCFIAVHSEYIPNFGTTNKIVLRTASKPEGEWSAPQVLFMGMQPVGNSNRAGQEHPELAKNGGKTIYVSYYRPLGLQGELRLVEVTFQ